mmetsp:Transcript_22259/g.72151  ORF Transcript_22259/g.72151 Transcript_22259/m.72151 type:complete len:214 (-) Transcript_22259:408-1049(-)
MFVIALAPLAMFLAAHPYERGALNVAKAALHAAIAWTYLCGVAAVASDDGEGATNAIGAAPLAAAGASLLMWWRLSAGAGAGAGKTAASPARVVATRAAAALRELASKGSEPAPEPSTGGGAGQEIAAENKTKKKKQVLEVVCVEAEEHAPHPRLRVEVETDGDAGLELLSRWLAGSADAALSLAELKVRPPPPPDFLPSRLSFFLAFGREMR